MFYTHGIENVKIYPGLDFSYIKCLFGVNGNILIFCTNFVEASRLLLQNKSLEEFYKTTFYDV